MGQITDQRCIKRSPLNKLWWLSNKNILSFKNLFILQMKVSYGGWSDEWSSWRCRCNERVLSCRNSIECVDGDCRRNHFGRCTKEENRWSVPSACTYQQTANIQNRKIYFSDSIIIFIPDWKLFVCTRLYKRTYELRIVFLCGQQIWPSYSSGGISVGFSSCVGDWCGFPPTRNDSGGHCSLFNWRNTGTIRTRRSWHPRDCPPDRTRGDIYLNIDPFEWIFPRFLKFSKKHRISVVLWEQSYPEN